LGVCAAAIIGDSAAKNRYFNFMLLFI